MIYGYYYFLLYYNILYIVGTTLLEVTALSLVGTQVVQIIYYNIYNLHHLARHLFA